MACPRGDTLVSEALHSAIIFACLAAAVVLVLSGG
jgi:hypothetical protein